jgi:hypothetical protein
MPTPPTYTARECLDGPWGALTCLIEEDGRVIAYCHREDLEGIVSALVAVEAPTREVTKFLRDFDATAAPTEVSEVVARLKAADAANAAIDAERAAR